MAPIFISRLISFIASEGMQADKPSRNSTRSAHVKRDLHSWFASEAASSIASKTSDAARLLSNDVSALSRILSASFEIRGCLAMFLASCSLQTGKNSDSVFHRAEVILAQAIASLFVRWPSRHPRRGKRRTGRHPVRWPARRPGAAAATSTVSRAWPRRRRP